jgi:hypothetical protein
MRVPPGGRLFERGGHAFTSPWGTPMANGRDEPWCGESCESGGPVFAACRVPDADGKKGRREAVGLRWNRSPDLPAAPYGCYRCAGHDRWCVIAIFDEHQWQALRRQTKIW